MNEIASRYITVGMTAGELKAWRERMGWTQERAAKELGVSVRGFQWAEANGPRRAMALHAARIEAADREKSP